MRKARQLRALINADDSPVLVVGAHDGLGAAIAQKAGYQAVWASGLEISASQALPDAGLLGMSDFLHAARIINAACDLPVIADCDTGFGNELNVAHMIHQYEAAGIAAVCIEDKVYPKMNSFSGRRQILVPIDEFTHKIRTAKEAQSSPDLIVIARTEALISGAGMDAALERAHAYADAGADAILIHSKTSDADEIERFAELWKRRLPLVAVPTTYHEWSVRDAARAGVSIIIHANQGLRASVTAMSTAFTVMLNEGRSTSLENEIATVKEVFDLQQLDSWMALER